MRLPDPSPVLDKNRAPMGPEILSGTGAGVWRKAPIASPDSSSVLDKFQSARYELARNKACKTATLQDRSSEAKLGGWQMTSALWQWHLARWTATCWGRDRERNTRKSVHTQLKLGNSLCGLSAEMCRGFLLYRFWRILPGIFLEDFSGHLSPQKVRKNPATKPRERSGGPKIEICKKIRI